MRSRFYLFAAVATVLVFSGGIASILTTVWAGTTAPFRVQPVDTAPLMGTPDPMPLSVEVAFPHLSFQRPLELTYAPDGSGRNFVLEQAGRVHVFPNDPEVRETTVFLDIRDVVSRDGNEEGLLGIAFHPRYADNGEFFVYYSTKPRSSIVSRFRVSPEDPDRALRDSEEILMRIDQPYGNHNGGCIRIGPDGHLYIGLGDGGAAHDPHGHGQDLGTLLGSILRIDIDNQDPGLAYAIPKDNPFVGVDGARGEIWAYGLRNVWRMAFDPKTGWLWAGDVGQNRYEEVDVIRRGGNYGWKIREGFHPFAPDAKQTGGPLIDPLAEYYHSEGLSVTGGQVYRGDRLPEYDGAYFYADYVSGQVWILRYDGQQVTENRKVARTNLAISAFGEDADGEMYITAFDGKIYRFTPSGVDVEAVRAAFPKTLRETGLFESVDQIRPVDGAVPYDVTVPLWSDHAAKRRWFVLPEERSVKFYGTHTWQFPVGTVLIKHFDLHLDRVEMKDPTRLETRLFVRSSRGWDGYTYLWNDEQTEATLLDGALTKNYKVKTAEGTIEQPWYFPSRADCMTCHTKAADFVLGPVTRQLNRPIEVEDAQVDLVDALGEAAFFTEALPRPADALEKYPRWEDASNAVADSARAYLDVNCSFCHRPGSIGGRVPDLRYHTPLGETGLVNRNPGQGRLGPEGTKLVKPGQPDQSELVYRISTRGPRQMPPVASNLVDDTAVEVIRQWIQSMEP